jgi:SH3 domain-containing YSC84-like protein 1
MRHSLTLLLASCVTVMIAASASAQVTERLESAALAFEEIMETPDRSVPSDLLAKAECLVLVPGVKKGAFIVGAKYGRGFVSCRRGADRGWSAPAGVRIEGGSVGFQIGGSETDVFMLVMNKRGVDRLLSSKFTLGADAAVAAGPVGRQTSAETDARLTAEILSWSRSRGVFAGVALNGATLRDDPQANRDLYGRRLSNRDILQGDLTPPPHAEPLMAQLAKY